MVCVWCTLKATSSLSFRSEIAKEKKNKRVNAKSIAARQARYLSSPLACLLLQGDSRVSKPDLNITS